MKYIAQRACLIGLFMASACAAPPVVTSTLASPTPGQTSLPYPYPYPLPLPTTAPLPEGYVWPPTPTLGPSPTPWPTLTPEPTWTPWPTPSETSLPTIVPPVQTVTADRLPPLTRDLLFLEDGKLMRWEHSTGRIEILVGPETLSGHQPALRKVAFVARGPGLPPGSVVQFSVSDDGRRVALERTAINPDEYEVMYFDLDTRRLISIYRGVGTPFAK